MKFTRRSLMAVSPLLGVSVVSKTNAQGYLRDATVHQNDATPDVEGALHAQASIAGNADIHFPAESLGELYVVSYGPVLEGGRLPFILRNDSDQTLSRIEVKMEARANGSLIAVDSSLEVQPATLDPGDVGLGYFYIDTAIDDVAEYTFKITKSESGVDDRYINVDFGEVNALGSSVVGEFENPSERNMEYVTLLAMSFDDDGTFLECASASVSEPMVPGEPVAFQVDFYRSDVTSFLISGSGW